MRGGPHANITISVKGEKLKPPHLKGSFNYTCISMNNKIKAYFIGIIIPVAVGLFSAFLTRNSMNVYETIVQPALAPPAILFPVVWTVLYVLMGIGSVMIYRSSVSDTDKSKALLLYSLQLAVNFFWSIIFFNKRAFLLSFIWLVLLWLLIIGMIVSFKKICKTATWLQIPYLIWVTFAGYLSLSIYLLNG